MFHLNLKDKVILITGGSDGLGFASAKLLSSEGAKIVICGRRSDYLKEKANIIREETKNQVLDIKCDVTNPEDCKLLVERTISEYKNIDVLINNAGFGTFGKFYKTDWKKEKDMINLHVLNTTYLTKLFLRDMIKKNEGKILNIASVAAFQPGPLMSLYYATKAYILHFTEAISNEVKDKNISISVLCPGQTKTNFQKNVSSKRNKINFNTASPVKVAKYGYESLKKNVTISVPGFWNNLIVFLVRILPRSTSTSLVRYIQEKNRD